MLLLLIAGLAVSPAPGAAWELVTHQRLTKAAIDNTLTESASLVAYLVDVGIDKDGQGNKFFFDSPCPSC